MSGEAAGGTAGGTEGDEGGAAKRRRVGHGGAPGGEVELSLRVRDKDGGNERDVPALDAPAAAGRHRPAPAGARSRLRVGADGRASGAHGAAEYAVTEHLRMSGIYWGLTSMYLMSAEDQMKGADIVEWVVQCGHPSVSSARAR